MGVTEKTEEDEQKYHEKKREAFFKDFVQESQLQPLQPCNLWSLFHCSLIQSASWSDH